MTRAAAALLLLAGCAHQAQHLEERHEEQRQAEQTRTVEQLGAREERGELALTLPAGYRLLPGGTPLPRPTPARLHWDARTAPSTTTTETARQSEAQAASTMTASTSTRVGPPWWAWALVGLGGVAGGLLVRRFLPF